MDIIVNDTNIFIDLLSVGLLCEMCELPYEIHTVDFVMDEITAVPQKRLISEFVRRKKIHVHSFPGEDLSAIANEYSKISGNLSFTDLAVCYYARSGSFKIITGDRQLRNYAERNRLEVRGILYLFDEMVENGIISPLIGAKKLSELQTINIRLPQSEIEARIGKWRM